ncbi:hypothetical protein [Nocardia tengchongensis]|uniref:hypothetical protein n=1 Tax=Nocardia tengchongensis TaxID=2055889 RepID=UPI003611C0FB
MSWTSIGQTFAGILGGASGVEGIRWLRGRSGDKAQTNVNHAVSLNQLAQTVSNLTTSSTELSASLSDVHKRLDAAEEELGRRQQAQSRLENLFRHAIEVIRDFMDIARDHDIPAPEMSDELLDEIASRT